MAKNNAKAKGFATDRKRVNKMARIVAIVICVTMVVTTFMTWGLGVID